MGDIVTNKNTKRERMRLNLEIQKVLVGQMDTEFKIESKLDEIERMEESAKASKDKIEDLKIQLAELESSIKKTTKKE